MNILFLSQFFDPEPTLLTIPFVQQFAAMGHHVEVLTGYPCTADGYLYPGWKRRWRESKDYDGVRVFRVPQYMDHSHSTLRRIANLGSFAFLAATVGQIGLARPDVVFIYTLPTLGLAASLLRWFRGAKIVIGAFDLWPDSLFDSGMLGKRHSFFEKFVSWYCRKFYAMADRILIHSPGIATFLTDRGIPADRIETFYLWCSEPKSNIVNIRENNSGKLVENSTKNESENDSDNITDNSVKTDELEDRVLRIVFTGNMGPMQDLGTVLDAAKILQDSEVRVSFRLVGGGTAVTKLKEKAAALSLKNVTFTPPVPMSQIPEIQAAADAMIITLRDIPLYRAAIPSKIQYALYGGTPILCGVAGDATELVERIGAGVCFTPGNPESLVAAVRILMEFPAEKRREMGKAGKQFYMENLHSSIAAVRMETIFRSLVER